MTQKKSFLLHVDSLDILDELTDEEAGMLFKAIRSYQRNEEIEAGGLVRIAFSPFRNQFNRDNEKYEKLCEKNRLIAVNRHSTKSTSGRSGKPSLPIVTKSTDNDSKKDSDNDSKSDSDKDKEVKAKGAAVTLNFDSWSSIPSDDVLKEWLSHRKKRKLSVGQLVVNKMAKEINKAIGMGYSVDTCLSEVIERGWQGFNSDWIKNSNADKSALHNLSNKDYSQHEGKL